MSVVRTTGAALLAVAALAAVPAAQLPGGSPIAGLHGPLDRLLDIHVRDGLVYYNALRAARGSLDGYVASLNVAPATYEGWSRDEQAAFWLNAYNAFVLQTVVRHYPIRGQSDAYPANSLRQVPGAFDRQTHRAAGRGVTLDQIEQEILPTFGDPRLYLALGRGAVGGGRLRSEAYTGPGLAAQLEAVTADCVARSACSLVDRPSGELAVTPVFSWREQEFVDVYAERPGPPFPGRSPIELAVLRLLEPHVLPTERAFLSANTFRVRFMRFDWRLNDLTGGPPD